MTARLEPRHGRRAATATLLAAFLASIAGGCSDDDGDTNIAQAAETTLGTTATRSTATGSTLPESTLPESTTTTVHDGSTDHSSNDDSDDDDDSDTDDIDIAAVAAANLATAAFQDVEMAEASGYASTVDALGCFENDEAGGMGLHYLDESLMDDVVDISTPEALVYELDAAGAIVGLVAHEYIVPVEAWTSDEPPNLFGVDFHQHPVLPLWVLHAWIWKDNPAGMFADWNPTVRPCPSGVAVFGVDLP